MKAYEKLQQFMREKHRHPDWEAAWRGLIELTDGLTKEDPRSQTVMDQLEQCDSAFLANDWLTFQQRANRIKAILSNQP